MTLRRATLSSADKKGYANFIRVLQILVCRLVVIYSNLEYSVKSFLSAVPRVSMHTAESFTEWTEN
jgi:hypothetical protein